LFSTWGYPLQVKKEVPHSDVGMIVRFRHFPGTHESGGKSLYAYSFRSRCRHRRHHLAVTTLIDALGTVVSKAVAPRPNKSRGEVSWTPLERPRGSFVFNMESFQMNEKWTMLTTGERFRH
jgi:hypothetical protein